MTLPLQVAAGSIRIPDFSAMTPEDWDRALEKTWNGYDRALGLIETGQDEATLDNTFFALEEATVALMDVIGPFECLRSAVNTDAIGAVAEKWIPKIEARASGHLAHPGAYERFKSAMAWTIDECLVDEDDSDPLWRLMDRSIKERAQAGAALDDARRAQLAAIDEELGTLGIQADRMISKAASDSILIEADRLGGMDPDFIEGARDGQVVRIGMVSSAVNQVLKKADDRQVRQQVFEAYKARNHGGENDTGEIINRTLELRSQRAELLGFDNWAQMTVSLQMAGNSQAVKGLLEDTWQQARPVVERELAQVEGAAREDGIEVLEPWDRAYYQERVREAKFDLDMDQVRRRLPLSGVKAAMFECARELFDLQARPMAGVHGYHPDCEVWSLKRRGETMGVLVLDYGAREHKGPGAWMNAITSQHALDGERRVPVVINVCNFQGADDPETCLLDMEEAVTVFHEFGHALHEILSQAVFPSQAGTNVARDFVELPSQLMENWIASKAGLMRFAKMAGSDEGMALDLAEKVVAASRFGMGCEKAAYLASAMLDLAVHDGRVDATVSREVIEQEVARDMDLPRAVSPYHRLGHFSHLFGGGYAANYYSYLWAEVLEADVFEQFQGDMFNERLARRLEETIYSTGGTRDPQALVEQFLEREVDPGALVRRMGGDQKQVVRCAP